MLSFLSFKTTDKVNSYVEFCLITGVALKDATAQISKEGTATLPLYVKVLSVHQAGRADSGCLSPKAQEEVFFSIDSPPMRAVKKDTKVYILSETKTWNGGGWSKTSLLTEEEAKQYVFSK